MKNKKDLNNIEKFGAIHQEILRSVNLILVGFAGIQNHAPNLENSFLTLHLLSSGFERLMKINICLAVLLRTGKYPDSKLLHELGHNLVYIKNEILAKYYTQAAHMNIDFNFLNHDNELNELLTILGDFGIEGRYYNFNIISGKWNWRFRDEPQAKWEKFKLKVIFKNVDLKNKILTDRFAQNEADEVASYILKILEKFVWAISRQFVFGLSDIGRKLSPLLMEFYSIPPDDFGKKIYRKYLL